MDIRLPKVRQGLKIQLWGQSQKEKKGGPMTSHKEVRPKSGVRGLA